MRMHNPPHPGAVLREYLGDMAVTAAADHLGVSRVTLSRVWMQAQYDLWNAARARRRKVPKLQQHAAHA